MIIDITGIELSPWDYENCKGKYKCCDECNYYLCCMSDKKNCKDCSDPYCEKACKMPDVIFTDLDLRYVRKEFIK